MLSHDVRPSLGKGGNCPPMYQPHLHAHSLAASGFALTRRLARMRMPGMRFLFVWPGVCLVLLSNPASRLTPLSSANGWCCQSPQETFTLNFSPMPGTQGSHVQGHMAQSVQHDFRIGDLCPTLHLNGLGNRNDRPKRSEECQPIRLNARVSGVILQVYG